MNGPKRSTPTPSQAPVQGAKAPGAAENVVQTAASAATSMNIGLPMGAEIASVEDLAAFAPNLRGAAKAGATGAAAVKSYDKGVDLPPELPGKVRFRAGDRYHETLEEARADLPSYQGVNYERMDEVTGECLEHLIVRVGETIETARETTKELKSSWVKGRQAEVELRQADVLGHFLATFRTEIAGLEDLVEAERSSLPDFRKNEALYLALTNEEQARLAVLRVLAAAPELLETLKACISKDGRFILDSDVAKVQAVIAKAEGREVPPVWAGVDVGKSPNMFTLVATRWSQLQGNESWEVGTLDTIAEVLAAFPTACEGASRVIVKENGKSMFSISGDPKCPQISLE